MARLRRADEIVVRQIEDGGHLAEAGRVAIGQFAWGHAFLERRLLHLQTVLVGAGEKEHVLAVEPLEARDCIGCDRFIGMPDVGHAVGIGNGRRDVEACAHGLARRHVLSCGCRRSCPEWNSQAGAAPREACTILWNVNRISDLRSKL